MTSDWSRRRGSDRVILLLLVLLLGTCLPAVAIADDAPPRVRPADPDDPAWRLHGPDDQRWSRTWPADWTALEALADTTAAPSDSLLAAIAAGADGAVRPWSDRLRERWHRRGHPRCAVDVHGEGTATYLVVAPGPRARVGSVALDVPGAAVLEDRLVPLMPTTGAPCDARVWERAVRHALEATGETGRPFVSWTLRGAVLRTAADGDVIDVEAAVVAGDPRSWGPVVSDLPTPAARSFLVRAARLPRHGLFRHSELRRARERLQARGAWRHVGEPVVYVPSAPDTVGVHWPIVPVPSPNSFAVMLGLSRPEGGERTRISGRAELGLGNIAGTGRSLELNWSDDGGDRSDFGIGWGEPLAFGTPLDLVFALDQEVVADVHTRFRVDGGLSLPVRAAWHVELGFGYDRGSFPTGTWTASRRVRTRGALRHRRLDPLGDGWSAVFAVENARRSATARAVEGAEATVPPEERQTIVSVELDAEVWLGEAVSLGARGLFDGVSGDGEIPLLEQSRLGGARTLRGYREDRFHGTHVGAAALELRLGRAGRSRVYTFLDLGYVRDTTTDPATEASVTTVERPYGFGLGLATAGAGGDLSLAVGFPGTVSFDEAKLHVSLQQTF